MSRIQFHVLATIVAITLVPLVSFVSIPQAAVAAAPKAPATIGASSDQDDESALITSNNVHYIYDAYAAKPLGVAHIASLISQDFNKAPDEFAQWDYLQKLLPTIQRKTKEAKEAASFQLRIDSNLARYDFDNMAFPSSFSENTFIPIGGSAAYAIQFANVKDFVFIPVPIETARKFQIQIRQSRSVKLEVTIKPQIAETKVLNRQEYHVVSGDIKSFRILLSDGQVLAEKKL